MRVVFVYLAQLHQVLHTFPIAMELARDGAVEVHLAAGTRSHLDYMRELSRFYPGVEATYALLRLPPPVRWWAGARGRTVVPKKLTLLSNLAYLRGFDAVVVPERTSLFLRRFDMGRTQLVWTGHGAGDRESGFTRNVAEFDFVLLPGEKLARRHLALGNVREDRYGIGGYAKFDLVRRMREGRGPLFDNGRATVVYNPHFDAPLSSWHAQGFAVLDFFAASRDYNLVFAPHLRLFDPPTADKYRPFERYRGLDHVRIDLGGRASIDMTYTLGADIYLGDVSSQIAEFLIEPRPMVFLNPTGADWRGDPNFRFWDLGTVAGGADDLERALAEAVARQPLRRERQVGYFRETYDLSGDEDSAPRGAAAIRRFVASA